MVEDRAKLGPTVAEYAAANEVEEWTVRRWISGGFLKTDQRKRPMRITGGEPPLTHGEFMERLKPTLAKARPGTFGQAEDGSIQLLRHGEVREVPFQANAEYIPRAQALIEQALS